ncbi:hypothetical protein CONPUDRAFT_71068 [Coniophora puteana RWD-64-598 SS2]|uniref:Uncharacterized protein n=1 Tax=Coniophora puteana (strain RWD-64-598) TaxID=741705 RepID=A0A5M3MYL1_CONPW|nr:uncharacterized protein CONPUDRAFT_71068 [Coniophora puteana RWD-64-598 SS2]EIW84253.1 hypothetical protein CONPUDRAFT_71068 [Coniophora puteana RWD-64-598 SS2]
MALGLVPYSEMALAKTQYAQIVGYGDGRAAMDQQTVARCSRILSGTILALSPITVLKPALDEILGHGILAADFEESAGTCLMTRRVSVLYRPSKVICILLSSLFVIAQATSILSVGLVSVSGAAYYQTLSKGYCSTAIPKDDQPWRLFLDVLCPILLEFVLLALTLIRFVTNAKASRRRLLRWSVDDILHLVVRDNIVYFVIILACFFMTSRWALPHDEAKHYTLGAAAYIVVCNASQVFSLVMCGPRIILNVRRFYGNEFESHHSSANVDLELQLTTIQLDSALAEINSTC